MVSGARTTNGAPQGARAAQTHDEVCAILKSLPNRKLKGVRLEINAEWFGTAWASSDANDRPRYVGVVDKWKTRDATLMVKWDGWGQNKQSVLDSMDKDANGDDLNSPYCPTRTAMSLPSCTSPMRSLRVLLLLLSVAAGAVASQRPPLRASRTTRTTRVPRRRRRSSGMVRSGRASSRRASGSTRARSRAASRRSTPAR